MAARAYWQGQIRLALVSIPVEIYSATKSGAAIAFHQIHEPSGKRVKYEKVVPGIGAVDPDEIVKGYEVSKGDYILLDEKEIAGVKLESKKTLELTQFVDYADLDPIYYDKPYYVVPADDLAEEAYVVLREALRAAKKVGLGQLAMRGREYVVSLKPCGRGLVLETLRYADEVNKASGFFRDIADAKPDDDLLDLAGTLIAKKAGKFDAGQFHDRYIDALKALIERKKEGKPVRIEDEDAAPKRGGNVIDLMAALKKSLDRPVASNDTADDTDAPPAKPAPKKASAGKAPAAKSPVAKAAPAKPAPAKPEAVKPAPAPAGKAPARKRA